MPPSMALPAPGSAQAWRMAMRPPTLTASVAPVLVGTGVAIAEDAFRLLPALAALFGAVCLQVGANFANDVFDHRRGADTAERLGPPRAAQLGLLSPRALFAGMWVAFALATVAGVYLAFAGGWPIVAVGLASIVGAIVYTGGPWPAGYHALGDLMTFVFFGFVAVCGTVYVQAGELPPVAFAAAVPVGATVTMILVVNNLRDIPTDRRTGKTTLAVVLGEERTRRWYLALLGVTYGVPLAMAASLTWPFGVIVLGSLPRALPLVRAMRTRVAGPALNPVLRATARFTFVFGVLWGLGIALSGLG